MTWQQKQQCMRLSIIKGALTYTYFQLKILLTLKMLRRLFRNWNQTLSLTFFWTSMILREKDTHLYFKSGNYFKIFNNLILKGK